jgi:hypothetical protein
LAVPTDAYNAIARAIPSSLKNTQDPPGVLEIGSARIATSLTTREKRINAKGGDTTNTLRNREADAI